MPHRVRGSRRPWDLRPCRPSPLEADDAGVPADALVLLGWGLVLLALTAAAFLIGRLTARLFLRATGARIDRR